MTKEITKAFILQQIEDKFKLREWIPEKFVFSEEVVPVYNIEQHLLKVTSEFKAQTITEIAAVSFYTVPATEKWHLHRYSVVFISGAFTTTGVMVGRPEFINYTYLDLKAGVNTSYLNDLPKTVTINPGDIIGVNVDGFTSSGALRLYIDVTKEEIR